MELFVREHKTSSIIPYTLLVLILASAYTLLVLVLPSAMSNTASLPLIYTQGYSWFITLGIFLESIVQSLVVDTR